MKNKFAEQTSEDFIEQFSKKPDYIFLSPGRINIIGEHIDYNDGYVLPAAIDKYICFAISENDSSKCTIIAKDLNDSYQFDLKDKLKPIEKSWVNYILGVLSQLIDGNYSIKGFDVIFSSTIPMGAGLSSSAALECGICFAMNTIFNLGLSKENIARIGQKSEHNFVGVNCGIMDQFASVFGKANHVIKLDCNTLEYEYHKADFKNYSLLLFDSRVKHTHLTSGYNVRRQEVEKGLSIIKNHFPEVTTFRDCTEEMILTLKSELGNPVYSRCHFVVKEISRVQQAVIALENELFIELGELMYQTHQGLSEEYEVSCEELDFLVNAAINEQYVIGSRMMGGGFGGCSINLVEKGKEDKLIEDIANKYKNKFGIDLFAYKIQISEGTMLYQNK